LRYRNNLKTCARKINNHISNGFPLVTDWFTRAKQRPSFETAFYPKARLSEFLTISPLRV